MVPVPDMPAARERLTLRDLRQWHVLAIMCRHCAHSGQVSSAWLRQRWPAERRLRDLEARMRCGRCGQLGGHGWVVLRLPRNL
jgi:hypothetical protein